MGFSFGGFIVQARAPLSAPSEDGPGGEEARALIEALYRGKRTLSAQEISADEASSRHAEETSALLHGTCAVLFDRWGALDCNFETDEIYARDESLKNCSRHANCARVMAFSLDGTSGTYAFALFAAGARVRRWSHIPTSRGEAIAIDEGTPLPTEPADPKAHGEDRIVAAAESLLGENLLSLCIDRVAFICPRS